MRKTELEEASLYKYRQFGNEYHHRLLTEREVYFAPPIEFDDPKDCAISVRFGSNPPEEFVSALRENLIAANSDLSTQAVDAAMNEFVSNDKPISDERVRELISENLGVVSLSRNPRSPEMWRKYGQSHTGFCVGIDFERLNEWCAERSDGEITFAPLPVRYRKKRPTLNLSVDSSEDVAVKSATIKRLRYSFEQEYRLVGYGNPGEVIKLPDQVFEAVAVGKGASSKNLRFVRQAAKRLDTEIRIFKAVSITTGEVRLRESARV